MFNLTRKLSIATLICFLFTSFALAKPKIVPTENKQIEQTTTQKVNHEIGKVNINSASVSELLKLKGIGKKRAEQIVKDRETNGPFQSPHDLTRIKGIGPKTVENNLAIITVGSPAPQTQTQETQVQGAKPIKLPSAKPIKKPK